MTASPYRPVRRLIGGWLRYHRIPLEGSGTKERKPNVFTAQKSWATWFYEEVHTSRWLKKQAKLRETIGHINRLSEYQITAIIGARHDRSTH